MNNFDLKKFLSENKLTSNSRIEEQSSGTYWAFFTGASFDGVNAYKINSSNGTPGSSELESDIIDAYYDTFVEPRNEDYSDNEEDIKFSSDVEFSGFGGKVTYRGEIDLELEHDEVEFIVFNA